MSLRYIHAIIVIKASVRSLVCKDTYCIAVYKRPYINAAGTPDNRINCGNILSRCSY